MTRLKFLAEIIAGQSPPSNAVTELTTGIPFLQGNAEFGTMNPKAKYEATTASKLCASGDLLLSVRAPVGALNIADRTYAIGRGLCAIRPTKLHQGFLWWWIQHSTHLLHAAATGSTFSAIPASVVGSINIPTYSQDQQRAIAEYLDRETAQIDELISKQEALIETLRERRIAVITHSATTGIRGSVLVNSGVDSLGPVPENWLVSKFGRHMIINSGQVDPQEEYWRSVRLIAPNHIESGTGKLLGFETASEQGAESGKYEVKSGQIVFSKIRPNLNKVAIAPDDALCSADMYPVSSANNDEHRYVLYYMLSRPFHSYVTQMSMRVKMPKINRAELAAAPWLVPPIEEQREIVAYLDEQTAKIDLLIEKAQRFVELAKERRAALITAAVTGQIDVRGEAA